MADICVLNLALHHGAKGFSAILILTLKFYEAKYKFITSAANDPSKLQVPKK